MSRRPGDLLVKDPSSSEPQGFDWTAYVDELSTTLATSSYTVTGPESPVALTATGDGIVAGGKQTVVTLAGGTRGLTYTVTNHITTSNAVVDERSFRVLVENR